MSIVPALPGAANVSEYSRESLCAEIPDKESHPTQSPRSHLRHVPRLCMCACAESMGMSGVPTGAWGRSQYVRLHASSQVHIARSRSTSAARRTCLGDVGEVREAAHVVVAHVHATVEHDVAAVDGRQHARAADIWRNAWIRVRFGARAQYPGIVLAHRVCATEGANTRTRAASRKHPRLSSVQILAHAHTLAGA